MAQIARSKSAGLSRLLFALGIRHVGEKAARLLARRFRTLDAVATATPEALLRVPEIGPNTAEAIRSWFGNPANAAVNAPGGGVSDGAHTGSTCLGEPCNHTFGG